MKSRSLWSAGIAAAISLVPLAVLASSPAVAAPTSFVPADGPHVVATEFGFTGAPQSLTVPAGVTSLEVIAYGASGGSATSNDGTGLTGLGGRGAAVSATLDVEPGTVFSVNVGGRGADNADGAAGWNGGGSGGAADRNGAGGGGATDLRTCAPDAADCDTLDSRLLVAAGGGGAGFGYDNVIPGADAGEAGDGYSGSRGPVAGGQPGTATDGGTGGDAGDEDDRISRGGDGGVGSGGVGGGRTGPDYVPTIQENAGAGGGGGGLYGGGGGGDNRYYGAAGGGGSSLVPIGGDQGLAGPDTNGAVTVTYDLGPVTELVLHAASTTLPASGTASTPITAAAETTGGQQVAGLDVSFASSDQLQSFGDVTDNGDGTYTATLTGSTTAGTATITASAAGEVEDVDGMTTITQEPYTAPAITAALSSAKPKSAGWYRTPVTVTFTCSGSRVTLCLDPYTTTRSGRDQKVTGGVYDDQGGEAMTTVRFDIDRIKPVVRVTGAKKGATYNAAKKLTCKAIDTLSGVKSCKVTTTMKKSAKGTLVKWTGTAFDKAGNSSVTKGSYTIRKTR